MLRMVAVLCAALSLSACAVVSSERPLFSIADSEGAPILKPGLWALPVGDCKFSLRVSALKWPDCANATLVTGASLFGGKRDAAGVFPQAMIYRLASGEPVILQVEAPADRGPGDPKVIYLGLRPLASDGQGLITSARVWLALCAQPPPIDGGSGKPTKLAPGLTPIKGREECRAASAVAVRNAARQSEAWAFSGNDDGSGVVARWIRDGDR
ncbi:hypothetical protein [Phenylobacterium sp.]|uniref:hypothetical protein n=1 Tax=Phenylobacterium sp. TaxID=1871053 RepID=UPI0027276780|nr:hypothetical protein [Phenylobacterium sp.]MDO8801736.1 hypothetical protein [Phenylobacterium sp.]